MSRSSFGKPPQPQLGMSGPKAAMQPPPGPRPPPLPTPNLGATATTPSMFRRMTY